MSRMSDIHAAASEIDITDADAIQALADSIAAERYAPEIYAYAACHAGGFDAANRRFQPAIAAYSDAVRRILESLPPACRECGESLPDYLPVTVKCDECADNVNGTES